MDADRLALYVIGGIELVAAVVLLGVGLWMLSCLIRGKVPDGF